VVKVVVLETPAVPAGQYKNQPAGGRLTVLTRFLGGFYFFFRAVFCSVSCQAGVAFAAACPIFAHWFHFCLVKVNSVGVPIILSWKTRMKSTWNLSFKKLMNGS
jgi:hypothetical protein